MSARKDTLILMQYLNNRGIPASFDDANTLRRAQITLHRWDEQECGDGNEWMSWSIERDDKTNVPYRCVYPHKGEMRRERIADKEAGALRRVAEICKRLGAHYYHQGDPRGCSLYVSIAPITDNNYSGNSVACCV